MPPQGGRKHPQQEFLQVDTTNILFICRWCVRRVWTRSSRDRGKTTSIGFRRGMCESRGRPPDRRSVPQDVEPEDLLEIRPDPGIRRPCCRFLATLEDLDEDALVTILTEPKNALVKQYQRLFEMESVDADVRTKTRCAPSRRKAIERKTGARGLRSIMEDILLDTMFELPGAGIGVEEVVISSEVVEGKRSPCSSTAKGMPREAKRPLKAGRLIWQPTRS